VYMGVKVMACNGMYSDGVKVGVAMGVPPLINPSKWTLMYR
jgi:hypothetical protein